MGKAESFYLKNMKPEIEQFYQEVMQKLNQNAAIKQLYHGWKVWFSLILDEPDILFIGINPGSEDGKLNLDPDGELQYIYDESPKWSLKNDTMEVFNDEEIKMKVDLSNCVKTNYYYLATANHPKTFHPITDFLGRQNDKKGLGDRFFQYSKIWTKQMLIVMEPKLIICEGIEAFKLVTEYALEWKVEINNEDVFSVYNDQYNKRILGYKRQYPASGIKNKELLKTKLKELL